MRSDPQYRWEIADQRKEEGEGTTRDVDEIEVEVVLHGDEALLSPARGVPPHGLAHFVGRQ